MLIRSAARKTRSNVLKEQAFSLSRREDFDTVGALVYLVKLLFRFSATSNHFCGNDKRKVVPPSGRRE